ncbi:MAG: DedA family protein [Solirubrobacterales bacterium]
MNFLEWIYQFATQTIEQLGYWGLVIGMALESACMPVPSEIVLPFGGYMVSQGVLSFWPAVAAGVGGGLLGSTAAYGVGRYGGRPFILKYGRYFFVSPKDLHRADKLFERFGTRIVFWARLMPVVRTFISLPAGIADMSFRRFVGYTIAGSLPWTILFVYLGVVLGKNWAAVRQNFERFDAILAAILILGVVYWVVTKWIKRRQGKEDE